MEVPTLGGDEALYRISFAWEDECITLWETLTSKFARPIRQFPTLYLRFHSGSPTDQVLLIGETGQKGNKTFGRKKPFNCDWRLYLGPLVVICQVFTTKRPISPFKVWKQDIKRPRDSRQSKSFNYDKVYFTLLCISANHSCPLSFILFFEDPCLPRLALLTHSFQKML